jgi:hypothetical protein
MDYSDIGEWSQAKLEIVQDYSKENSKILAKQDRLSHAYIDALAGSSVHVLRTTSKIVTGSPVNALDAARLYEEMREWIAYLESQVEEEREARRRADTLLARLMDRLPELEAPQEVADAAETVEQEPEGTEALARCPRRSGGCTAPVVEAGVRLVNQQTRRWAIAALVVVLLVLVASFGVGSKPNPLADKGGSSATNTLVGGLLVIVGGALTLAGNYWMETRRWKREDAHRDYPDRQRAYAEFLTSWHAYEEAKGIVGAEGRQALEEAELQFQRSFNILSLLAPEEVRAAAVELRKEAHGAKDKDGGAADDVPQKEGAPGRFWKAARKDLGKWPPRQLEERNAKV